MATIDELVILLNLNPDGVKKGMQQAQSTVSSGMQNLVNVIKGFAAPIAGAFAAGKLFSEYTAQADAIGKMSDALNVDMESLQVWGEAAARAGGSAQAFFGSVKTLNMRIQETAQLGTGRAAKVFDALGISVKDAQGNIRQATDIMSDLAAKAETMGKAEFAGIAARLGLDEGTVMLLQQGRAAVDEQLRRQRELGVYTKQDAEITAKFNDDLADLWQTTKAGSAIILRTIVPALDTMIQWAIKGVSFIRRHENFVKTIFVALAAAVTAYALPALAKLAWATASNPFTWLALAIVGVCLALEDLWGWVNGDEAALGAFWAQFGTPEEVKKKILGFIDTLKGLIPIVEKVGAVAAVVFTFAGLVKSILTVGAAIRTITPMIAAFNAMLLANPIILVVAGIIAAVIACIYWWDEIKAAVLGFVQSATEALTNFWARIKSIFAGASEFFVGVFSAVAEAIMSPFRTAFDWISEKWAGIKSLFSSGAQIAVDATAQASRNAGAGISPSRVGATSNVRSESTVNVGKVEVKTAATDADGISRDIGKGLKNNLGSQFMANQVNTGVRQ